MINQINFTMPGFGPVVSCVLNCQYHTVKHANHLTIKRFVCLISASKQSISELNLLRVFLVFRHIN